MDEHEKDQLSSVLGDIRKMVQDETRSRIASAQATDAAEVDTADTGTAAETSPPVLVLGQDMLVAVDEEVSSSVTEAVAAKHASKIGGIDPEILQEAVREVIREQLRGDLGKEIRNSLQGELKRDG